MQKLLTALIIFSCTFFMGLALAEAGFRTDSDPNSHLTKKADRHIRTPVDNSSQDASLLNESSVIYDSAELAINSRHLHWSGHTFEQHQPIDGYLTILKNTPELDIRQGFLILNSRWISLTHFLRGKNRALQIQASLKRTNRLKVFMLGSAGASIRITATGPGGNASAEVAVTVTAPEPTVILSAIPEQLVAGESATLTWETANADNVSIDNGIGTVASSGSLAVSPTSDTTYTITATGPGGSTTATAIIAVVPPIAIEILSPSTGESIRRPNILVHGVFTNNRGGETGITVNGKVAMVCGNQFAVNHVPLEKGANTITAAATDAQGNVAEASVMVNADNFSGSIYIEASPQSGIGPLKTELNVTGAFPVTDTTLTCSSSGTMTILEDNHDQYLLDLLDPGFYFLTVETAVAHANRHTDTVALCVMDAAVLDAMLKAKWSAMLQAMATGNKQAALEYFSPTTKSTYERIFTALESRLPRIAQDLGNLPEIEMVAAEEGYARYRLIRPETHQGRLYDIAYDIYFDNAGDGLWRVVRY